jgi:hypothetical protein
MKKKENVKKIELVFPDIDNSEQAFIVQNTVKGFATTVEEIQNWFNQYDVDSIQLWISGAIQTGGVLKLIISASGQGGVLVTLKPKKKIS